MWALSVFLLPVLLVALPIGIWIRHAFRSRNYPSNRSVKQWDTYGDPLRRARERMTGPIPPAPPKNLRLVRTDDEGKGAA